MNKDIISGKYDKELYEDSQLECVYKKNFGLYDAMLKRLNPITPFQAFFNLVQKHHLSCKHSVSAMYFITFL